MIVRKIRPEEYKRTCEIFAIAFEDSFDNTAYTLQAQQQLAAAPKTRDEAFYLERWAAFEDDNTTMLSFFAAKPYPVHFDGQTCTMAGIGGVATLPQYRRRGGVRACFEAALPALRQSGVLLSYLYPFSTAYYRRFGYELCCERVRYRLRLDALPRFDAPGSCTLVEQGTSLLSDIRQIYSAWQNSYNLMLAAQDYEFAWVAEANPPKDQQFSYVYHSAQGAPLAYMTLARCDDAEGRQLRCNRIVFCDVEGFMGLMNLARTLASDHHTITFELPPQLDIAPLLPEWSLGAGTRQLLHCGMARILDVPGALRLARYRGSGRFVVQVQDALIPQNDGCFALQFTNGHATQVDATDAAPDITLPISDFSRLLLGACDTDTIRFMPDVQLHTGLDAAAQVFYRKPLLLTEYF